jgi:hypothetical protein
VRGLWIFRDRDQVEDPGATNTTINYVYGGAGNPATMLTSKTATATSGGALIQQASYAYNLQGAVAQVVTSDYAAGTVTRQETNTLLYDDA